MLILNGKYENSVKIHEKYRPDKRPIKLAVFEHITSPTAIIFPIKELTELFHSQGAMVTNIFSIN